MIYAYANVNKSNSLRMVDRFLQGAAVNGQKVTLVTDGKWRGGPAVFYGVQKELLPVWRACLAENAEYYWIDNGYIGSKWSGGTYYRITLNALQHYGAGQTDGKRIRELGVQLAPWRVPHHEARPLVALQSRWWYEFYGTTLDDWLTDTLSKMERSGWPEPVIRSKDDYAAPIDWGKVSAVVTHSSNVAVDAIMQGVPAVTTQFCAGGYADAKFSDWPNLPRPTDRYRWAGVLADNQWSLREIESGLAWRMLNR